MEYLLIVNIIIIIGVAFLMVWAYKLLKAVYRYNAEHNAEQTAEQSAEQPVEQTAGQTAELNAEQSAEQTAGQTAAPADASADGGEEETYVAPEYSDDDEEENQNEWWKGMTPKELFKRSMEELGCKYERDEDKSYEYYVKYQGETFIVHVGDDLIFIRIYDLSWYEVSIEDLDTFSEVRRLVNEINYNNIATIVYSIDKENNVAYLHTNMKGLFAEFIPSPEKYLARLFNDMIQVQRIFFVKMGRFKGDEA